MTDIAKTNCFKIENSIGDIVQKLTQYIESFDDDIYIGFGNISIKSGSHKYEKTHIEIRKYISKKNNIPADKVIYSSYIYNQKIYYLYLTTEDDNLNSDFMEIIKLADEHLQRKILSSLFNICFNMKYHIKNSKKFKNVLEASGYYNSNIIFGQKTKTDFITGIYFNTYFSPTNELFIIYNRKRINLKNLIANIKTGGSESDFKPFTLDGRKYRLKFYQYGEEYNTSIMFFLTEYLKNIENIFKESHIDFKNITWYDEVIFDNFIKQDSIDFDFSKVINVDNRKNRKETKLFDIHTKGKRQQEEIDNINIKNSKDINIEDISIKTDNTYLFVNGDLKESSQTYDGEILEKNRDVIDVYYETKRKKDKLDINKYDKYTQFKQKIFLLNLKGKDIPVSQGVELSTLNKNPNFTILKKIQSEILIKSLIFKNLSISIEMEDSSFDILYIRNKRIHSKRVESYFSYMRLNIKNKKLTIENKKILYGKDGIDDIYDINNIIAKEIEKDQLNMSIPGGLNNLFYLYDNNEKYLLKTYTNIRTPIIVGNKHFDNNDRYYNPKYEGSDNLSRKIYPNEGSLFPYTLVGKKYQKKVFIKYDVERVSLQYINSLNASPPQSLKEKNPIYNLLVINNKNELILGEEAYNLNIVQLFFKSFTEDFTDINNIGKSSLFKKMAKTYLLN